MQKCLLVVPAVGSHRAARLQASEADTIASHWCIELEKRVSKLKLIRRLHQGDEWRQVHGLVLNLVTRATDDRRRVAASWQLNAESSGEHGFWTSTFPTRSRSKTEARSPR